MIRNIKYFEISVVDSREHSTIPSSLAKYRLDIVFIVLSSPSVIKDPIQILFHSVFHSLNIYSVPVLRWISISGLLIVWPLLTYISNVLFLFH